ncbi:hypothetical protein KCU73_g8514, partial [Aureobasidium melanogenum]
MSAFHSELRIKQRWGFVIYRTDYSSEEDWQKFTIIMDNWTMKVIRNKGPRLAPVIHSWQKMWWFNDQAQFENASIEHLRSHFRNNWYAGLSVQEQSNTWPEHYMFLVVDKEALESVRPLEVELPRFYHGEYPYLKVWDKEAPAKNNDYPGRMNIKVPNVFYLYELALQTDDKSMKALRSKSTDWFSRDLVWYEDDHYGDKEEDIDAEEHEGGSN